MVLASPDIWNFDSRRREAAASLITEIQTLAEQGESVVSVLLGGDPLDEYRHFPASDARAQGYRFFYHGHTDMPRRWGEHGHFHIFSEAETGDLTHLIGLSVDPRGLPLRAFTTNRWVTDERWQPAHKVIERLATFSVECPSAPAVVNRWLQALLCLFWPSITACIRARDARVDAMKRGGSRPNLLEDRRMHVLTSEVLSLPDVVVELDAGLAA